MNDRYLFRGKSIHPPFDWIQGGYAELEGVPCIVLPHLEYQSACQREEPVYIAVDPDTVSQCTGLRDKNGALVFEGDVITTRDATIAVIKIGEYRPEFFANFCGLKNNMCELFGPYAEFLDGEECLIFTNSAGEVIGNRWDDPELLDVAD